MGYALIAAAIDGLAPILLPRLIQICGFECAKTSDNGASKALSRPTKKAAEQHYDFGRSFYRFTGDAARVPRRVRLRFLVVAHLPVNFLLGAGVSGFLVYQNLIGLVRGVDPSSQSGG